MATTKKYLDRKRRHNRVRSKINGTAERPRLVVFKSLNFTYGQIVDDESKKVLAAASDMKIKGGTKSERAAKTGLELAKLAKEKKITKVVFDRNGYRYHGRIKALADAAREGGLQF